jgi:hypothetical protein
LNDCEIIYFSKLKVWLNRGLLSQNPIACLTDDVKDHEIVDCHHKFGVLKPCEFKANFKVGRTTTILAKRSSRHKIVVRSILRNYCARNTDSLGHALQTCGIVSVQLRLRDAHLDSRVLKDEEGTLESGSHYSLLA